MNIKTVQIHAPTVTTDEEIFNKYIDFVDEYQHVSLVRIEEYYFIVKALGRKDYKDIMTNEQLNMYQKEEVVCEVCTLYPSEFDFGTCEAGIPEQLCKEILTFSHFTQDTQESAVSMMNFFRSEMVQLHNQINCLIQEAFPNFNFEEIENWPMEKTLRYLSRSEWILQNLRGIEMNYDPFTGENWNAETIAQPIESLPTPQRQFVSEPIVPEPEEIHLSQTSSQNNEQAKGFIAGESLDDRIQRAYEGKVKKERLTPEKLRELQTKYPEVDWARKHEAKDFEVEISSEPMALRTPNE